MNLANTNDKILIQFDGICVLCSRTVQFLLKADRNEKFMFQTLQDRYGSDSFDTIIVIQGDKTFHYFDAVLKISNELGGIYKIMNLFRILPAQWRKAIYIWIAKNRFRWFGIRKTCFVPKEKEKTRFI